MSRPALILLVAVAACGAPSDLIDRDAVFDRYDWWDSRDFGWYEDRIPFVETPDAQIDEVYYYRWEVLKTHLTYGSAATGYTFTEFIDRPFWSGAYGSISCPLGHQFSEVRWLNDARVIDDFARYWFDTEGAQPRRYSNWYASSLWQVHEVWGDDAWIVSMLPYMEQQYRGWVDEQFDAGHGMFFKTGHDDGMEININSRQLTDNWVVEGYRPTLNSYLFADLRAMSRAAALAGDDATSSEYAEKAETLKKRVIDELWDPGREFFFHQFKGDHDPGIEDKSLTYETGPLAGNDNGRELIGYVPWQFHLPDAGQSVAWKFLMDEAHFKAPFGPTTTSRSDPQFMIAERCCVWSGQSWPYATTQTLVALANLLNDYEQDFVDTDDYVELLRTYARTQYKDGRPYVAESADPMTGSWYGSDRANHSEHYLHSGYVDLVLSGLLGIRPQADGTLVVNPLVPADWDWFAVDDVRVHGHDVDLVWDRDGSRYDRGAGLSVWVDGREAARTPTVGRLTIALDRREATLAHARPHNLAANSGAAFPEVTASWWAPSHAPFYAVDGTIYYHRVPTNRWTTEGSPNAEDWIEVDFGAPQTVRDIRMYFLDDGQGVVPPSDYRIQVRRDGEWVAANERSRVPAVPTGRTANVATLGAYDTDAVRVTFVHAPGGRTGLAEIEIWTPDGVEVRPADRAPSNRALNLSGEGLPAVSVSFPEGFDARVLNDGLPGGYNYQYNRWTPRQSPNDVDWVQVELARPVAVSSVELALYGYGVGYLAHVDSSVAAPRSITVEVERDGAWASVSGAHRVPEAFEDMGTYRIAFDPVETRHVRVLVEHDRPAVAGLSEVRVR